jgi:hypothetical protein
MTRGKRFKRLVRARAAETGQSYSAALRRFRAEPKEAKPLSDAEAAKCSFCGKSQEEVAKLVAGPGVYICDRCIRLGYDIVSDQEPNTTVVGAQTKPPFARFDDRARKSLVAAQEEARQLHHNFIGTEHVLLGVVTVADGLLAELFASHGLHADGVRSEMTQLVRPSKEPIVGSPPFTPRARQSLQLAGELASNMGDERVNAAHLVLGMLAEGEGLAAQFLQAAGIGPDDVHSLAGPV